MLQIQFFTRKNAFSITPIRSETASLRRKTAARADLERGEGSLSLCQIAARAVPARMRPVDMCNNIFEPTSTKSATEKYEYTCNACERKPFSFAEEDGEVNPSYTAPRTLSPAAL